MKSIPLWNGSMKKGILKGFWIGPCLLCLVTWDLVCVFFGPCKLVLKTFNFANKWKWKVGLLRLCLEKKKDTCSQFTFFPWLLYECACKSDWIGLEAMCVAFYMCFSHFWLVLAVRMQADSPQGVRAEGKGEVKRGCQRSRWRQAVGETDYLNEVWLSVSASWKISNVKQRGYREKKDRVLCTTAREREEELCFLCVSLDGRETAENSWKLQKCLASGWPRGHQTPSWTQRSAKSAILSIGCPLNSAGCSERGSVTGRFRNRLLSPPGRSHLKARDVPLFAFWTRWSPDPAEQRREQRVTDMKHYECM